MPTLHLPAAHTDTDVALATEVAQVVGSHELYVSWTPGEGPAPPQGVETLPPAEPPATALPPFAGFFVAMARGLSAPGNAFTPPPPTRAEPPAPRDDRH